MEGFFVWFFDALQDLEDDGCVAVVVEVDFLVVGDLADAAVGGLVIVRGSIEQVCGL